MSIAYLVPPVRAIADEEAPAYDGQRKSASFVMIPTEVGATIMGTLGASAFGVYWHLARRSKDGKCWPSLDDIAEATTLSRKHVTRMLDALENDGWITRTRRSNNFKMATSTLYELPHLSRTYGCDMTETSLGHDTPQNVTVTRVITRDELDNEIPPSFPPVGDAPKEPKPKVVQASRIPDDFTADPALIAWAEAKGFKPDELAHHTERFKNYWGSEGGTKARKVDWRRAWQTWISRETPGRWPGAPKQQYGSAAPKPSGTRIDSTPITQESHDLSMAMYRERQFAEGDMRCGPRPEGGWLAEHNRKYAKQPEPSPTSYNGWEPTPIRQGV